MLRKNIKEKYFTWLCSQIAIPEMNHSKLLKYLDDRYFYYLVPMDDNRGCDGINLRYRYADETKTDYAAIAVLLDDDDCSVLEMLIALAIRCEEHIMENSQYGNRTAIWFWTMLDNCGLSYYDDEHFDISSADEIITRILDRTYEADGVGGLFPIKNCKYDLRTVEIWYQLNWYLNQIKDQ